MIKAALVLGTCATLGVAVAQVVPIMVDSKAIVSAGVAVAAASLWVGRKYQKLVDAINDLPCRIEGGGCPPAKERVMVVAKKE